MDFHHSLRASVSARSRPQPCRSALCRTGPATKSGWQSGRLSGRWSHTARSESRRSCRASTSQRKPSRAFSTRHRWSGRAGCSSRPVRCRWQPAPPILEHLVLSPVLVEVLLLVLLLALQVLRAAAVDLRLTFLFTPLAAQIDEHVGNVATKTAGISVVGSGLSGHLSSRHSNALMPAC